MQQPRADPSQQSWDKGKHAPRVRMIRLSDMIFERSCP